LSFINWSYQEHVEEFDTLYYSTAISVSFLQRSRQTRQNLQQKAFWKKKSFGIFLTWKASLTAPTSPM